MNCSNCKEESTTFGICTSDECHSGKDKTLFCDGCYDEHVENNHSHFKELTEEELGENYGMKSMYHLVDSNDNYESYGIFESVLDCDIIEQIEKEATIEFQKENSLSKTEIFFEILYKKDPNYEIIENIQEIHI
jgi:hypothetical protein